MHDAIFSQTIIDLSQMLLLSGMISFIMYSTSQSLIPGYILTGIFLGPYCFELISETGILTLEPFGQIGIMLLLFVAGLEIDLSELLHGAKIALPVFCGELVFSFILSFIIGYFLEIDYLCIILWSFVLTLSSTASALKTIKNTNSSIKSYAIYAISILIIQDIFFSSMQLILGSMSGKTSIFAAVYNIFVSIIGPCLPIIGLFYILQYIQIKKHAHAKALQEHNTLILLSLCLSVAGFCDILSLSMEYGSFFGGLVCGALSNRHEAERHIELIVRVFSALFFIWIGLTTNLTFITEHLFLIVIMLVLIHIFKILTNALLIYAFTYDKASLHGGLLLMTLSEFSFALIAVHHHDDFHSTLLKALIILSMFTSNFWINFFTKHKDSILVTKSEEEKE